MGVNVAKTPRVEVNSLEKESLSKMLSILRQWENDVKRDRI
jgi:hypothetical protein